ncbi:polycomb protein suz12-like isoform X2 [Biomphalaria glabrata]|uniref:Polycomb protein suz12-like isoform X2 n=1 Tax=Biomphalaria glabrata TaxID=6526 RepID=A0A9U8E1C6_BIOGL|nr:polycomb protein suz12-like isoform X2 [Biomphalaria glabrata]
MGPKRRAVESNGTLNDIKKEKNPEADHELFLQAFEKPTQIYRYLRTRSLVLPVFLPRTLTYMRHRRSVSNSKIKTFKVDSILGSVEAKLEKDAVRRRLRHETLQLSFSGFHIADFATEAEFADVEVLLLRICQKKRKESCIPIVPITLAKLRVPVNPKPLAVYPDQVLEIPSETFTYKNGHTVRSHVLLFKVQCATLREASSVGMNGDNHSPSEPPIKRRRNGRISSLEEEILTFCRELVVYDKNKVCLLTQGKYELGVQTSEGSEKLKLNKVWESFTGKNVRPLELFTDFPTLKFNLAWIDSDENCKKCQSENVSQSRVPPPRSDLLNGTSDFSAAFEKWAKSEYNGAKSRVDRDTEGQITPRKRMRVFYQFTHNDCTQQETEARDDLRCPWCCLSCQQLYSLLKHLRLCHSRFNFLFIPHPKGARIDVSLNERYDGSYVGNPQDIHSHVGYAFSRSTPVRRTPITHVIVYRPKRPPFSLAEFQELESDSILNRQLIQGHNRLYFHTGTCQPVLPQELDTEGREESKPRWLRQKTIMMIDEFTDVNEGEKELMKMWNLHVMDKEYIGDCMVPQACFTFVAEHGAQIVQKNLCRNFLLHLVNLFDFSLIRPEIVQRAYAMLETLRHELGSHTKKPET